APHHRLMRSVFDSLVVALPGHRYGPWLAERWQISPDGREYTFELRKDVKFHDGTRFDAQAVKFNFDRIHDAKNALLARDDLGPYVASDVVAEFTIKVRFDKPYAPFLANLSKSCLGMLSPAAVAKYKDEIGAHPIGTGPFRFTSLTAPSEVVLTRNADYAWSAEGAHKGPAFLERVVFKNVPEEATRVAVLLNGQAGASDLIPPQNLAELRRSAEFRVIQGELLNHNYALHLNVTRAPWNDQRVREAFRDALDISGAVKTIYLGSAERAWSPLSPSLFGYDKSLEGGGKRDRAAAERTLDALGYKKGADGIREKGGKRLTVVLLDTQGNREKRLDLQTVFRRQLRDVGFDLRIDTQPSGAYLTKSVAGDYDLLAGSQFAADPDVLRRLYTPSQRSAYSVSRVDDPELNQLLEQAYRELDAARRADLYAQAQQRILKRVYSIPTYVLIYTIGAARKVRDLRIDVHGFPILHDAWVRRDS
ncbi:MAG TPA: ABC transporter substrate-binding protein, partial [Polyangiales bacterium]|nr:ABC transporter substrate-binding protein [Polyangiales bacterium]